MVFSENKTDCIVVGAGLSGLVLARRLTAAGYRVLILEKSKAVGGRIATRRDGPATYDHGAQFYKLSSREPWPLDTDWAGKGLSHVWFQDQNSVFKNAPSGMTVLVKELAQGLQIVFEQKVTSIQEMMVSGLQFESLQVECESGAKYESKFVFISSPLPQSRDLLKSSGIAYPVELNKIDYASALVGLFEVESENLNIRNLKYMQDVNEEMFSVSNQLSKKTSSTLAFAVVMQPQWSQQHFLLEDDSNLAKISYAFTDYLRNFSLDVSVKKSQLKKWRYSHPLSTYSSPHLVLGAQQNIYLVGDAFGGPSLRGAADSADSIDVGTLKHK